MLTFSCALHYLSHYYIWQCNETPLHFAAKFGQVAVVELLANEPAMDKERVNKDGLTAAQVACTRSGSTQDKQRIVELLKGSVL